MGDNLLKPQKPYLGIVDLLHSRNMEGEIAIGLKGTWDYVSLPVHELHTLFGDLIDYLGKDSYYTPNTLAKPRAGANPYYYNLHRPLPRNNRKQSNVLYLNACFLDFDSHKLGKSAGDVAKAITEAEIKGTIPPATLKKYSGRGFWLYWLIYEPDTRRGAKATPENRALWLKIQQELGKRLEYLKAGIDERVKNDCSSFTRLEGSINSHSGERVFCQLCFDEETKTPFSYTLDGLRQWLGFTTESFTAKPEASEARIEPVKWWHDTTPRERKAKAKTRQAGGWRARWQYALNDFTAILNHRGKFLDGTRHNALLIYVNLLYRLGLKLDEVTPRASQLGTYRCEPPLPQKDILAGIKEGMKKKYASQHKEKLMAYQFISNALDVSLEESQLLCEVLLPAGSEPARKKPQLRKNEQEHRRAMLAYYLRGLLAKKPQPAFPTLRQLKAYLDETYFITASLGTIKLDLHKLGLKNPRKRRATKKEQELPLETAIQ